jgi:hypothetical protein
MHENRHGSRYQTEPAVRHENRHILAATHAPTGKKLK